MEPTATPAGKKSRDDLAGVVLAAGSGRRLLPLSDLLPKALCPVGNRALVDLALDRLVPVVGELFVNAHHRADLLTAHLEREWGDGVTVSVEAEVALGTAGGLARLRESLDGRAAVVVNADAWSPSGLSRLVDGWDGSTVRLLVHGDEGFGPAARILASTLPWSITQRLEEQPSGLYEVVWKELFDRGELEVVAHHGLFHDCGTPLDYLLANLDAVAVHGGSIIADDATLSNEARLTNCVIGSGAQVDGEVVSSVVWPGQSVGSDERLSRSIRAGTSVTVGPL